jgi:phosphotransacetylase
MFVLPTYKKPEGRLPRAVLCESFDQRVLRAAQLLSTYGFARVILLGDYNELDRAAVGYRTDLTGTEIMNCEEAKLQIGIKSRLAELDPGGNLDPTDPVVAGAYLVRSGLADAVLAGAATPPAHVMRIYLKLLGAAEDCKTVSGMSLVAFDKREFVRNQVIGLADVSVIPEPTVEQLADIAIQSALNYSRMTGVVARVAFLSFSTLGSSDHPAAKKVKQAADLAASRRPDLAMDGEMQIDAALVPAIAGTKAPSSSVAGTANVLVFPSLDAGNIAVKIFQNFSECRVLGPLLQGLAYHGTYIPRASAAEDIVDQVRLLTS